MSVESSFLLQSIVLVHLPGALAFLGQMTALVAVKTPLLLFQICFSSLGCRRSPFHGFIYDLFTIIHLLGNTISSLISTPVEPVATLITPLHDIYLHWNWCWWVVCTNFSYPLPDRGYGHQPIMQPRYLQNNLSYRHLALQLLPQWQLCGARSPL